jgi:hypothetical protein
MQTARNSGSGGPDSLRERHLGVNKGAAAAEIAHTPKLVMRAVPGLGTAVARRDAAAAAAQSRPCRRQAHRVIVRGLAAGRPDNHLRRNVLRFDDDNVPARGASGARHGSRRAVRRVRRVHEQRVPRGQRRIPLRDGRVVLQRSCSSGGAAVSPPRSERIQVYFGWLGQMRGVDVRAFRAFGAAPGQVVLAQLESESSLAAESCRVRKVLG